MRPFSPLVERSRMGASRGLFWFRILALSMRMRSCRSVYRPLSRTSLTQQTHPLPDSSQVYVTVPTVSGLATPAFALKAFVRVWLPAGAAGSGGASTVVPFVVPAAALQTTLQDGTRATTPGSYTVWASGHLPMDPVGLQQSNVVSAEFALQA